MPEENSGSSGTPCADHVTTVWEFTLDCVAKDTALTITTLTQTALISLPDALGELEAYCSFLKWIFEVV